VYTPKHFALDDPQDQAQLMRDYPFAALMTTDDSGLVQATHVPLVLDCGANGAPATLYGHLANSNPQLDHGARPVLAVFHGPHAYISPPEPAHVPTWNFTAVHVTGTMGLLNGQETAQVVDRLTAVYEGSDGWSTAQMDPRAHAAMIAAITGFRIDITDIQGKAKLSQNKPASLRATITRTLEQSDLPVDRDVARLMRDRDHSR